MQKGIQVLARLVDAEASAEALAARLNVHRATLYDLVRRLASSSRPDMFRRTDTIQRMVEFAVGETLPPVASGRAFAMLQAAYRRVVRSREIEPSAIDLARWLARITFAPDSLLHDDVEKRPLLSMPISAGTIGIAHQRREYEALLRRVISDPRSLLEDHWLQTTLSDIVLVGSIRLKNLSGAREAVEAMHSLVDIDSVDPSSALRLSMIDLAQNDGSGAFARVFNERFFDDQPFAIQVADEARRWFALPSVLHLVDLTRDRLDSNFYKKTQGFHEFAVRFSDWGNRSREELESYRTPDAASQDEER